MLRVSLRPGHFLGPGKVRLLELIDETGSISAAARLMEMSYRRAWLLVDNMNLAFRAPVLIAAVGGTQGGGAVLTPFGHEVVARYRHMEGIARKAINADLAALKARARTSQPAARRSRVKPPRVSRIKAR